MKNFKEYFPEAYAIYDVGEYYGVGVQESFYLVDKTSYEIVKTLMRYDNETVELIENAIPIWFADD